MELNTVGAALAANTAQPVPCTALDSSRLKPLPQGAPSAAVPLSSIVSHLLSQQRIQGVPTGAFNSNHPALFEHRPGQPAEHVAGR